LTSPDSDPPAASRGRLTAALPFVAAWGGAAAVAIVSGAAAWPSACAVLAAAATTGALGWARERARSRAGVSRARALAANLAAQSAHTSDLTARLDEAQSTLLSVASELEARTEALEESNRHFELALQGSNDGVWEYDIRTRRVYLSPGFRERLGLEPGEFHGQLAWFEEHLHPDDVERWRAAVQAHLEQRTSYNMDVRLCTPSGEYRWFRARGSAEWDFTGQPIRMSGSLTDTTERRYAEGRVRESEENFRSLSAASPVGILRADAFGLCEYCNQRWQEITGLSDFEALGEGWLDAIDVEDKERVLRRWTEYVCTGDTFDEQFRVVAPDGGQRWVRSRANAMRDEKDTMWGFVVTFEDVTGEKQAAVALADARDKAMQAAQAKSEFLANMSHEIRTPLNGVVGMTELLSSTELGDEQRDFVRTINTSADALLSIINDILDFSKIEAGKMSIERVEFDLRTLYEDVAELLAPRARERGLELVLAVEPSLPRRVVGDPTRIRQILINLASNAIKFTEQGEVVLSAEAAHGPNPWHVLKLRVSDTGIGIPAERLGAVFESFTQADGSTTRKYGGTGLGLTICRQLTGLMGGTIHVASEPGQGSDFWVELPLQPAAAEASGRADAPCDLTGARVLVVDDHAVNRRILGETLRAWGARPETVASGAEALARVESAAGGFELVLMDYRMAGMDGMEASRRLHALPHADRRFVIMTSSAGQPAELAGDIGPGRPVELWLTRPLRESSLARVLSRLLGRVSAQTQVAAASASAEEFATLSILLVDDNEVNRKVASRMLQKLGASASVAVNGAEAVHRIAEQPFDLVFMDCQMPEMDGFEATRVVRAREATHGGHVRIVAMTANAMEGDREACIACGMDDYVSKPVKLEPLLEQLRFALASRLDRAA
jgi:PAS domain S-box-containing protein